MNQEFLISSIAVENYYIDGVRDDSNEIISGKSIKTTVTLEMESVGNMDFLLKENGQIDKEKLLSFIYGQLNSDDKL